MEPNGIQQVVISPNMVFREGDYKILNWKPFEEFNLGLLSNQKVVTFYRQYALGDIIQLVVFAREFKKQYKVDEIRIITSNRFLKFCKFCFNDIKWYDSDYINWLTPDFGYIINFNSILERDHDIKNCECYNHRIHILLDYMECNHVTKEQLDWSCNLNTIKIPEIKSDLPIIGLQIRGSGKLKTLPFNQIKQIANELARYYTVVLIDHDKSKGFTGKNIVNYCGMLNIPQVIKLLQSLDCCITMDSGILWLAHIAKCPVVTLLASTRENERLTLHPLYPNKAKAVNLAEIVGCQPCFETMCNCNGKINCMNNVNYDKMITEIKSKLKSVLGVQSKWLENLPKKQAKSHVINLLK